MEQGREDPYEAIQAAIPPDLNELITNLDAAVEGRLMSRKEAEDCLLAYLYAFWGDDRYWPI